jgi:hypothetical protein
MIPLTLRASTPSSTSIQFLHKWLRIVIISSYYYFSTYQMKNIWSYLPIPLGSEQSMETNPSTHPRAVQKMWTIRNRYEQNMETNPSMHPRAVQKTWTIRNRYGHRYAKIRIPPTVSVSDRRRLTGLRDLRPWYR